MIRVRASRALSRAVLGRDVMLCALAEWHRWRIRRLLNALAFWDWGRDHCASCADWEARRERDPVDVLDDWRAQGWL